eukprot:COSAG05_NODE_18286_length_310_cov_1.710900_1_plen_22_part_10
MARARPFMLALVLASSGCQLIS